MGKDCNKFSIRAIRVIKSLLDIVCITSIVGGIILSIYNQKGIDSDLLFYASLGMIFYPIACLGLSALLDVAFLLQGAKGGSVNQKNVTIISFIILIIFILFEAILGAIVFDYYITTNDSLDTVKSTNQSLLVFPFQPNEKYISKVFNDLYFTAASTCNSGSAYFWSWITEECPGSMDYEYCQSCEYYSLTFCVVDNQQCELDGGVGSACPYSVCREGVLNLVATQIVGPLAALLLGFAFFHFIIFIFMIFFASYRVSTFVADMDVLPSEKKIGIDDEENHVY